MIHRQKCVPRVFADFCVEEKASGAYHVFYENLKLVTKTYTLII